MIICFMHDLGETIASPVRAFKHDQESLVGGLHTATLSQEISRLATLYTYQSNLLLEVFKFSEGLDPSA